VVVI